MTTIQQKLTFTLDGKKEYKAVMRIESENNNAIESELTLDNKELEIMINDFWVEESLMSALYEGCETSGSHTLYIDEDGDNNSTWTEFFNSDKPYEDVKPLHVLSWIVTETTTN